MCVPFQRPCVLQLLQCVVIITKVQMTFDYKSFYECVCMRTCLCVHVCVCGGQRDKLGYCPQVYQLTLWCRVCHWAGAQQLYLTCLARELQESSYVPSTGIACTQHGAWHFYVVGGVFVVSVCLMECFSSSALAVMSNTVNFNILLFIFCLLQFFFTPFPLSAQFCVNKTLGITLCIVFIGLLAISFKYCLTHSLELPCTFLARFWLSTWQYKNLTC